MLSINDSMQTTILNIIVIRIILIIIGCKVNHQYVNQGLGQPPLKLGTCTFIDTFID